MPSVNDFCVSVITSLMKIRVFLNVLFTFGSYFHSSGTCGAGCATAAGRAKRGPPARSPAPLCPGSPELGTPSPANASV